MNSDRRAVTVGMLGRVPPPLGGAGLERQMDLTAAALERRGHRVFHVDAGSASDRFDVLHAFGSEPAVWHQLRHWTRNPAPLVVTPIVVVSPGRDERLMRISARVPGIMSGARMRAEVLARADSVIAGTEYERGLVTSLGADPDRTQVIGNGAESVDPGTPPPEAPTGRYALLVGAVSARKRQEQIVRGLAGRFPVVVAGGFAGDDSERTRWDETARLPGVTWLGHVDDRGAIAALQQGATALVHLSAAEVESLAVLECLAQGTPVVLSDIPSHRALRARYPDFVELVAGDDEVPGALERIAAGERTGAPVVPTWDDVAEQLEALYSRVLAAAR
jgi:glycosyltransferase involved in cell wall biosynthesis